MSPDVTAPECDAATGPAVFVPVRSAHAPVPRRSAAGLGIVPDLQPDPDLGDGSGLRRYSVVHLGSGLAVFSCVTGLCAVHVHQAVALMGASGIDWTRPPAVIMTEPLEVVRQFLTGSLGLCADPDTAQPIPCLGDLFGPRPVA